MKKHLHLENKNFAQTNYNIYEFMSVKVSFVTPEIQKIEKWQKILCFCSIYIPF